MVQVVRGKWWTGRVNMVERLIENNGGGRSVSLGAGWHGSQVWSLRPKKAATATGAPCYGHFPIRELGRLSGGIELVKEERYQVGSSPFQYSKVLFFGTQHLFLLGHLFWSNILQLTSHTTETPHMAAPAWASPSAPPRPVDPTPGPTLTSEWRWGVPSRDEAQETGRIRCFWIIMGMSCHPQGPF